MSNICYVKYITLHTVALNFIILHKNSIICVSLVNAIMCLNLFIELSYYT